jgi:outer membrane usher protein
MAQTTDVSAQPVLMLYDTQLNQQPVGEGRFLKVAEGSLYLHETDLINWRLLHPEKPAFQYNGQTWIPLNGLAGFNYKADEAKQAIQIELSARAFSPSVLVTKESPATFLPTTPSWGGFVNYDLLASGANGLQLLSGSFEANLFGPYGTLHNSFVGQNLWSQAQQDRKIIRQDTVWSRDWPDEMLNVQVGDTQGKGGLWGRPVYFGGLRWGRNFATQPGFITTPTPLLSGEAILPSTIDLYIDGVMRNRLNVPSGSFSLGDFPQMTGQGEAKLIVRDILGREQVIVAPYGATGILLKQGIVDYSLDAGAIRKNYGLASNDYGQFMAAATVRKGLNERFTIEGRGEYLRDQQTAGVGGSVLTMLGIVTAAAAASHQATAGSGSMYMLSLEKQRTRINFGLRGQVSSANFVQIGGFSGVSNAIRTFNANLGWQMASGHLLGANYSYRSSSNQPASRIATLNYNTQLGAGFSLNVSMLGVLSEPKSSSLMFFVTKALNNRGGIGTLSGNINKGQIQQPTLQLQQATWRNGDWGYRAIFEGGKNQRQELGLTLRTQAAIYSADASHVSAATNYRVNMQGGAGLLDGKAFVTQRINDSFAVVHVPGQPNVEVSSNNWAAMRTDARGVALLPDLYSYQSNSIEVNPLTLPIDAQLANSRKTLVPYSRSGLSVTFDVKNDRSALLTLMLEDGKPAPVGMIVKVGGISETFMVGLRGEVFLTGLDNNNNLKVEWGDKYCQLQLSLPDNAGVMSYIDPMVCKGVSR